MAITDKQWQMVVNIHRVNLFKYKEIIPACHLPNIHTYHSSIVHVKTIINELKNYS